jgi:hypothetical protein
METKQRKTRKLAESHKDKISISMMNNTNASNDPHTEEHKKKISDALLGDKSPRQDLTIYIFKNEDQNLEFVGNSFEFRTKFNLDNRRIHPLTKGVYKQHKGWTCAKQN